MLDIMGIFIILLYLFYILKKKAIVTHYQSYLL